MHTTTGGKTTAQPWSVGVDVHCARVGNTALQPAAAGVDTQVASEGRTALQPANEGADTHVASDGSQVVGVSGKAPLDELRDQLALLDSKLDEIVDNLRQQDAEQLAANRDFLEQHFGGAGA